MFRFPMVGFSIVRFRRRGLRPHIIGCHLALSFCAFTDEYYQLAVVANFSRANMIAQRRAQIQLGA